MKFTFYFYATDFSITMVLYTYFSSVNVLFRKAAWIVSNILICKLDCVRLRQDWLNQISTPLINLENLIVFWACGILCLQEYASENTSAKSSKVK